MSKESIINQALMILGKNQYAFTDEDTQLYMALDNAAYKVLSEFAYSDCLRSSKLAKLDENGSFGYKNVFALPQDIVKVCGLFSRQSSFGINPLYQNTTQSYSSGDVYNNYFNDQYLEKDKYQQFIFSYEMADNKIYSNLLEIEIDYIASDISNISQGLLNVIAYQLAYDMTALWDMGQDRVARIQANLLTEKRKQKNATHKNHNRLCRQGYIKLNTNRFI